MFEKDLTGLSWCHLDTESYTAHFTLVFESNRRNRPFAPSGRWDLQNKATRTSPSRLAFVLEVPLCNLRPGMCDFVPCDQIVQMDYCLPKMVACLKLASQERNGAEKDVLQSNDRLGLAAKRTKDTYAKKGL